MFNYSDIKATLTVTPEVSPSLLADYYTKEQSDSKFVIDVIDENDQVYGRIKGSWVKLEDLDAYIYFTYAEESIEDPTALIGNCDINILNDSLTTMIEKENKSTSNCLWIFSTNPLNAITLTPYNIPITFTSAGDVEYKGKQFLVFKTSTLEATTYKLLCSFNNN